MGVTTLCQQVCQLLGSFSAQCGSSLSYRGAPQHLHEAVFAAYGWKSDLSDEEVLERLLALNLDRSR